MKSLYRYIVHRNFLGIGIFILLLSVAVNILIPLIVRELFNEFVNGQFQYSKVSILVLLFSLNVLLGTIGNAIIEIVGEKSVYELRTKLIDGIEHLRIRVAQDYNTNETVNHVVNDTEILGEVISSTLPSFVVNVVSWIGAVVMLFVMDWKLTSLVIVFAICIIIIIKFIGKKLAILADSFRNQLAILNNRLSQLLNFLLSIKISDSTSTFVSYVKLENKRLYDYALKGVKYRVILAPLINCLLLSLIVLVFSLGFYEIKIGLLSVGTFISFMMYLYQLVPTTLAISTSLGNFVAEKGALTNIIELMKNFSENSQDFSVSAREFSLENIRYEDVSLEIDDFRLLEHINLDIKLGEIAVIIGPSGVGKTSFIKQLLKVYDINSGKIFIGDIDLKDIAIAEWYNSVSYVSQETFFIDGYSLISNLKMGKEYSDEKIRSVLNDVGLWQELDCGNQLNEIIIDKNRLSGGQLQRLALARALLEDRKILILDEATSSLDQFNERRVLDLLNKRKSQALIIQISHRKQVIECADQIIDLEKFKIS